VCVCVCVCVTLTGNAGTPSALPGELLQLLTGHKHTHTQLMRGRRVELPL
jgi:hypothetical protein